jgi:hypothetical protein
MSRPSVSVKKEDMRDWEVVFLPDPRCGVVMRTAREVTCHFRHFGLTTVFGIGCLT